MNDSSLIMIVWLYTLKLSDMFAVHDHGHCWFNAFGFIPNTYKINHGHHRFINSHNLCVHSSLFSYFPTYSIQFPNNYFKERASCTIIMLLICEVVIDTSIPPSHHCFLMRLTVSIYLFSIEYWRSDNNGLIIKHNALFTIMTSVSVSYNFLTQNLETQYIRFDSIAFDGGHMRYKHSSVDVERRNLCL